jgi:hypothetical protein
MMPSETDPQASSAGKKPPSLAEQAFATVKILLLAALLGGIWLLDIIAT